ncbi:MAG: hypothetical protein ABF246_06080 [Winogradskyella sp.]
MILQNIALYSWTNGVIMIAIFALVCIILVGFLINFMMNGKKEDVTNSIDAATSLNKDENL